MRIRTIKPEFFDSPHTAKASAVARIAYIGLWCWADDTGRGTFNPKELEGAIFPNDDVTELSHGEFADFRGVLRQVAAAFGVLVYEVDGRTFFQVPSWERHQRVRDGHESRLPGPDTTNARVLNEFSGSHDDSPQSAADCGNLPPGTGEQGNRGTGEQGKSTPNGVDVSAIADDAATTGGAERREDVEAVCEAMASSVERRTGKRPGVTKSWRTSARLLIDRDGIAADDAIAAISWSENDDFWRANILSVPKLREKYATLSLQAQRSRAPRGAGERMLAAAMAAPDWYPGVEDPPGPALGLIEGGAA